MAVRVFFESTRITALWGQRRYELLDSGITMVRKSFSHDDKHDLVTLRETISRG